MRDDRVMVTLVHGTYAQGAAWTFPDSGLAKAIAQSHASVIVDRMDWSGGNDIVARRLGAFKLVRHLQEKSASHPGVRHILIGHSHGGNVILDALREVNRPDVLGVCCLATPFLHFRVAGEDELPPTAFSRGFFAVALLVLVPLVVSCGVGWPAAVAILVATWLATDLLGWFVWGGANAVRVTAADFHRSLSGDPGVRNLKILRRTGDEASLLLAVSRGLSWVAANLARHIGDPDPDRINRWGFKRRRLPRTLVWVWLAALVAVAAGAWLPGLGGWAEVFAFAALVLTFVLLSLKTKWFDDVGLGFAVLGVVAATLITSFLFGTAVPRRALRELKMDRDFSFLTFSLLLTLILEVSAEASPSGEWRVHHINDRDGAGRQPWTLAHSIYDDPRAIAAVAAWVRDTVSR